MKTKYLMGVKVDTDIDTNLLLKLISDFLRKENKGYICTINPEFIVDAQLDSDFKKIINNSYLSLVDGTGILYGLEYKNRIKSDRLVAKIMTWIKTLVSKNDFYQKTASGSDNFEKICEFCEQNNYSIGLIGGWPKDIFGRMKKGNYDMSKEVKERLISKFPKLDVRYCNSKYSSDVSYDSIFIDEINKIDNIDILFVAFGHIKQEKWIYRNLEYINVRLAIGVGGTFDYYTQNMRMPPKKIKEYNLEWLFRLIQQPWRLARIYKALFVYSYYILKE